MQMGGNAEQMLQMYHTGVRFCSESGRKELRINPLKPNDPYRGRTAPLTSKDPFYIFIQQMYLLNILNMVYTLSFFLFKMQSVS
jgi:hypothetical protein